MIYKHDRCCSGRQDAVARYHLLFSVVMLDGFDTAAIGFIAPDIRLTGNSPQAISPRFLARVCWGNRRRTALWSVVRSLWPQTGVELCVFLFGALSLASAFSPDCKRWYSCVSSPALGWVARCQYNYHDLGISACPPPRRAGDVMFCGFTLGSAFGGIVSAQLCR